MLNIYVCQGLGDGYKKLFHSPPNSQDAFEKLLNMDLLPSISQANRSPPFFFHYTNPDVKLNPRSSFSNVVNPVLSPSLEPLGQPSAPGPVCCFSDSYARSLALRPFQNLFSAASPPSFFFPPLPLSVTNSPFPIPSRQIFNCSRILLSVLLWQPKGRLSHLSAMRGIFDFPNLSALAVRSPTPVFALYTCRDTHPFFFLPFFGEFSKVPMVFRANFRWPGSPECI